MRHRMLGPVLAVALIVTAAMGGATATAQTAARCATAVSGGQVAGRTEGGVCEFGGIPYAAPPVGARRFRPPAPPRHWHGVLRATRPRAVCPQDRDALEEYPTTAKRFTDENCLFVNVWTPRPDGRRRPVMVFIPGGAFVVGSASEPMYDGFKLAARGDAVVVSLNYRLGMLGWLELGGLDPAYRGSGNNGLRDQIAALRWVQRNISSFGGDPRDVTVFGESAGAISVSALLATRHPERLFHRAIMESGSGYLVHTAAYQRLVAQRHFAAGSIHSVAQLRALSTSRLLDLQAKVVNAAPLFSGDTYFAPYVDGRVLPGAVVPRLAAGSARHIRVLSGTNENETGYWALYDAALLDVPPAANPFFPTALSAQRDGITAAYRAALPGATEGAVTHAMLTDQLFRIPQIRLAQAQARWQPGWMYLFRWHVPFVPGAPAAQNLGAIHGIELGFVFGNLDLATVPHSATKDPVQLAERRLLSDRIMDAWLSFARTGNPNTGRGAGVPAWPAYSAATRATMTWDAAPAIVDAPADAERALWDAESFATWDFTP